MIGSIRAFSLWMIHCYKAQTKIKIVFILNGKLGKPVCHVMIFIYYFYLEFEAGLVQ